MNMKRRYHDIAMMMKNKKRIEGIEYPMSNDYSSFSVSKNENNYSSFSASKTYVSFGLLSISKSLSSGCLFNKRSMKLLFLYLSINNLSAVSN